MFSFAPMCFPFPLGASLHRVAARVTAAFGAERPFWVRLHTRVGALAGRALDAFEELGWHLAHELLAVPVLAPHGDLAVVVEFDRAHDPQCRRGARREVPRLGPLHEHGVALGSDVADLVV